MDFVRNSVLILILNALSYLLSLKRCFIFSHINISLNCVTRYCCHLTDKYNYFLRHVKPQVRDMIQGQFLRRNWPCIIIYMLFMTSSTKALTLSEYFSPKPWRKDMPSESSFNPEAEAISFMSLTLAPAQVNEPKAAKP